MADTQQEHRTPGPASPAASAEQTDSTATQLAVARRVARKADHMGPLADSLGGGGAGGAVADITAHHDSKAADGQHDGRTPTGPAPAHTAEAGQAAQEGHAGAQAGGSSHGGHQGHAGGHGAHGKKASAAALGQEGFTGPGQELPDREHHEKSFGVSFSDVRVYTDAAANKAAKEMNARAYTVGNQIAFAEASLLTNEALVAHELTHVVQNKGAAPAAPAPGKPPAGGKAPARKAATAESLEQSGIDFSGEAQAEQVEAAVGSGQSAQSALGGGAVAPVGPNKGPARSEGTIPFATGMSFSLEGLQKFYDYEIWKAPPIRAPIPIVPGLFAMIEPSVKVRLAGNVNWEDETLGCSLGVEGDVGFGFEYGVPEVCNLYGILEARALGGMNYQHAHGGTWDLHGGIDLSTVFRIGVSLAGGIVDFGFECGECEMGSLTGIEWTEAGFQADKLGWAWGEKPLEFFETVGAAIEQAQELVNMGAEAAQAAVDAAQATGTYVWDSGAAAVSWITSW